MIALVLPSEPDHPIFRGLAHGLICLSPLFVFYSLLNRRTSEYHLHIPRIREGREQILEEHHGHTQGFTNLSYLWSSVEVKREPVHNDNELLDGFHEHYQEWFVIFCSLRFVRISDTDGAAQSCSWNKLLPENFASSRLANPGSPRMWIIMQGNFDSACRETR